MSDWIDFKDEPMNMNIPLLLTTGNGIYIRGSDLNPFFIQLSGEMKTMNDTEFTHWMPLPELPKGDK